MNQELLTDPEKNQGDDKDGSVIYHLSACGHRERSLAPAEKYSVCTLHIKANWYFP